MVEKMNGHETLRGNLRRGEDSSPLEERVADKAKREEAIREGRVSIEDIMSVFTLQIETVDQYLRDKSLPEHVRNGLARGLISSIETSLEEMQIALERYEPL